MTELTSLAKKPIVVIALSLLAGFGLCALLVSLVILPGFTTWQETRSANEDLETKITKVAQNISLVKGINTQDREKFGQIMDVFYPEIADYLHFATLNEKLAKAKGVQVTSFTTGGAPSTSATAATSPSVGPAAGSTPVAGGTPNGTSTTAPIRSAVSSDLFVTIAYKSQYEKLEGLLADLVKLDRLVGVSAIVFTKLENTNEVTANVTFNLPLSQKSTAASTSENIKLLTETDRQTLEALGQRIEYSAAPANNPIGKTDPFN